MKFPIKEKWEVVSTARLSSTHSCWGGSRSAHWLGLASGGHGEGTFLSVRLRCGEAARAGRFHLNQWPRATTTDQRGPAVRSISFILPEQRRSIGGWAERAHALTRRLRTPPPRPGTPTRSVGCAASIPLPRSRGGGLHRRRQGQSQERSLATCGAAARGDPGRNREEGRLAMDRQRRRSS